MHPIQDPNSVEWHRIPRVSAQVQPPRSRKVPGDREASRDFSSSVTRIGRRAMVKTQELSLNQQTSGYNNISLGNVNKVSNKIELRTPAVSIKQEQATRNDAFRTEHMQDSDLKGDKVQGRVNTIPIYVPRRVAMQKHESP